MRKNKMTDNELVTELYKDKECQCIIIDMVSHIEHSGLIIEKAYLIVEKTQKLIATVLNKKTTKAKLNDIMSFRANSLEWSLIYAVLEYCEVSYMFQLQYLYSVHRLVEKAYKIRTEKKRVSSDEQKKSD